MDCKTALAITFRGVQSTMSRKMWNSRGSEPDESPIYRGQKSRRVAIILGSVNWPVGHGLCGEDDVAVKFVWEGHWHDSPDSLMSENSRAVLSIET